MKRRFWIILGAVTVIHGLMNLYMGVGDDEAYYWVWSNHLALSYYDHPPMVAYIIWFFTRILGTSFFTVHLGALVSVTLFIIIIYQWVKEMFSSREALWAATIVLFIPIFFVGGTVTVPDGPLGLFWVLTLWLVYRALKERKSHYWYLAGLAVGLSGLSKYNGLLLPGLIFLYLIFSNKHRFWLLRKEPYIALLIGLIVFSPVIIWNYQHDWVSFQFQFLSRHRGGFSFVRFLQFIGAQFTYLAPLAFIYACLGFYRLVKIGFGKKIWEYQYLFLTSFPLVALFALNSFVSRSFKPHWPALGYIGGILGGVVAGGLARKERNFLKINFLICILLLGITIGQTFYPFLPIPPKQDITNDLYGWDKVSQAIDEMDKELPKPDFLLTDRYQNGAHLSFATRKEAYTFSPHRRSQFDFWQDVEELKGKDAIYVTHSRYFKDPNDIYRFQKIELVKEVTLVRGGKEMRTFYLYYCENFQGLK
ncbi:MAG TPA: glycosyltransferase family 39 protein [bacterium]|nr:glycosyltransferase family 39 protein [bacterium]